MLNLDLGERTIVGEGLHQPLVAITLPKNGIAPPLVRDLMRSHELVIEQSLILTVGELGTVLWREKNEAGKKNQSGPALTIGSRHLRECEAAVWEGRDAAGDKVDRSKRVLLHFLNIGSRAGRQVGGTLEIRGCGGTQN